MHFLKVPSFLVRKHSSYPYLNIDVLLLYKKHTLNGQCHKIFDTFFHDSNRNEHIIQVWKDLYFEVQCLIRR